MKQHNEDKRQAPSETQRPAPGPTRVLCLGATGPGKHATSKTMALLVEALHRAGPDGIRFTDDR